MFIPTEMEKGDRRRTAETPSQLVRLQFDGWKPVPTEEPAHTDVMPRGRAQKPEQPDVMPHDKQPKPDKP